MLQDSRSSKTAGRPLEVLAAATRLGLTSFGGPIAHLGYFRDEYVVRRKWVDEHTYADLVALCQFLPGPASSQVGMALGIFRAGLLGGQDIVAAQRMDMKMAGGGRGEAFAGQLDVEAFMQQAHEYAASGEGLDVVYKVLSTLALTHPMHTVRAAELQRWIQGGDYERILRGEYTRRGAEAKERPLKDDFRAAKDHYAEEARETMSKMADAAKRAASQAREAFRKAQQS